MAKRQPKKKPPHKPRRTWRERGQSAWDAFFGTWTRIAAMLGILTVTASSVAAWEKLGLSNYVVATRGYVLLHVSDIRVLMDASRVDTIRLRIQQLESENERLVAERTSLNVKLREPNQTPEQIEILSNRLIAIGSAMAKADAVRQRLTDECRRIKSCADDLD